MRFGNLRIAKCIVLVIVFDQGVRQLLTLWNAQPGRDRTRSDIAHHHFDRDNLDLPHKLLAHVEPPDEMRGDADMGQPREDILRNAVVDHALAVDGALFLGVEGGRIILEILDQGTRFRALIEDLGLAFVDLAATGHLFDHPAGKIPSPRCCDARCIAMAGAYAAHTPNGDNWQTVGGEAPRMPGGTSSFPSFPSSPSRLWFVGAPMRSRMMKFAQLFTEHPASVGENYWQPLRHAVGFGLSMGGSGQIG